VSEDKLSNLDENQIISPQLKSKIWHRRCCGVNYPIESEFGTSFLCNVI